MSPETVLLTPPVGRVHLEQWGVLSATGPDTAAFLQGQLTQDVLLAPVGEWRLAAYCSPKGRMLASFWLVKTALDNVLLVCQKDLLAATLKRLRMYVLRAKVALADASGDHQVWGLIGPEALQPAPLTGPCPAVGGVDRALQIVPPSAAPSQFADPTLLGWWNHLEVAGGIAPVCAATADLFVPQMLNYESVGGVNFKKGCYPGQEVVARSQFRGTLKRRAYLVQGDAPMQAGQAVYAASDAEQPCGTVAWAAPNPQGGWGAVASLQVSTTEEALTLGAPGGPALRCAPPPYPFLDI